MRVELRVPASGESVTEVQIAEWLKRAGDRVGQDEAVVLLETDKAAMELPSPVAGVLAEIVKQKGETAKVGEVLAYLEEAPVQEATASQPKRAAPAAEPTTSPVAEPPRVMPAAPEQGPHVLRRLAQPGVAHVGEARLHRQHPPGAAHEQREARHALHEKADDPVEDRIQPARQFPAAHRAHGQHPP